MLKEENISKRSDEELKALFEKFDNDVKKRGRFRRLLLIRSQFYNILLRNGSQDELIVSHSKRRLESGRGDWFDRLVYFLSWNKKVGNNLSDEARKTLYGKYDRDMAERGRLNRLVLVLDQFGNVLLWNGSQDETISSHIQRRKDKGISNFIDCIVCKLLNKIESNHCRKSVGE